jgi:predicted membrane protein
MSLKAFHIVFISVSTVLSAVFALWCFREFSRSDHAAAAAGGVLGMFAVAGLLVYGVRFLKRARGIGYL